MAEWCRQMRPEPGVAPGSTNANFSSASTRTPVICERSIIRPPSQTALPAMLWPAPRTATSRSCSRANFTAVLMSDVVRSAFLGTRPATRIIRLVRRSCKIFAVSGAWSRCLGKPLEPVNRPARSTLATDPGYARRRPEETCRAARRRQARRDERDGLDPLWIADGVAITASIHVSPDAAALLRRLMTERGLSVPEPTIGIAK